jgi:hypothetical protein
LTCPPVFANHIPMSRDEDVKDIRLFDLRTIERNIKRGLITRKDYERFLKSLPDASENTLPAEAGIQPIAQE